MGRKAVAKAAPASAIASKRAKTSLDTSAAEPEEQEPEEQQPSLEPEGGFFAKAAANVKVKIEPQGQRLPREEMKKLHSWLQKAKASKDPQRIQAALNYGKLSNAEKHTWQKEWLVDKEGAYLTLLEERSNIISQKQQRLEDWFTKYQIQHYLHIPIDSEEMNALLANCPTRPNRRDCFKAVCFNFRCSVSGMHMMQLLAPMERQHGPVSGHTAAGVILGSCWQAMPSMTEYFLEINMPNCQEEETQKKITNVTQQELSKDESTHIDAMIGASSSGKASAHKPMPVMKPPREDDPVHVKVWMQVSGKAKTCSRALVSSLTTAKSLQLQLQDSKKQDMAKILSNDISKCLEKLNQKVEVLQHTMAKYNKVGANSLQDVVEGATGELKAVCTDVEALVKSTKKTFDFVSVALDQEVD